MPVSTEMLKQDAYFFASQGGAGTSQLLEDTLCELERRGVCADFLPASSYRTPNAPRLVDPAREEISPARTRFGFAG